MTAYSKSIELGLTGTDEQIVAVLQTLGAKDAPVSTIKEWLRLKQLWFRAPHGYDGPLQKIYDELPDGDTKDGLTEFFSSVFDESAEQVRATWPTYGPKIFSISSALAAILQQPELQADLYSLFGGRPFADLTVEAFAAERADAELQAGREVAYSEIVSRANGATVAAAQAKDAGLSFDEILAAGQMAWDSSVVALEIPGV
jgi:hypothetical protein